LAWHRGLSVDAVAHFRRALERGPEARTYGYLADALNQAGDLGGAHHALEQALSLDPRNTKALNLMGRVLDRLGRPEEARDIYQRAREIGDQ
jgi:Flp pilus assembly protein TadD